MNDHELYSTVVVRQATTPIRLGDELLGGKICAASVGNLVEANIALEAECERLRQFQIAYNDWQAKTDWVQESAKPNELGRHRADVLRARIEALAAELGQAREEIEGMHKSLDKLRAQCAGFSAYAEIDRLTAELAAIKGQEPVAFYWQDIGYPEPRTHGPYFGQPSESALRNVDGRAIPVLLYTLPPHRKEGGE